MTLELLSSSTDVSSLSSEELRPIRIGAVSIQPQPNQADGLYVGLDTLLPAEMQAFCTSGGLCFVSVRRALIDGDLYRVVVGALPRYFDADFSTRIRHLHPHIFSQVQLDQLLEWDRSLSGMATCDVQELLKDHAKSVVRSQQQKPAATPLDVPVEAQSDVPLQIPHAETKALSSQDVRNRSKKAEYIHEEIVIAFDELLTLRELKAKDSKHRPSTSQVNRALLQTALRQLRRELQAEKRWQERRIIKAKERCLRQLCGQGMAHKLVEITPIYGRGKQRNAIVACRVEINVQAA